MKWRRSNEVSKNRQIQAGRVRAGLNVDLCWIVAMLVHTYDEFVFLSLYSIHVSSYLSRPSLSSLLYVRRSARVAEPDHARSEHCEALTMIGQAYLRQLAFLKACCSG